jgi:hypothetical protein
MQAAALLAQIDQQTQPVEITLLELVAAVADSARNDNEVIATVASLINSGKITLVGNFLGADVRVS